jgi:hypothetical protein
LFYPLVKNPLAKKVQKEIETMKRILFLSALFFILAVQISWEQIPQTISYQGVLTDANGKNVPDGDYNLTFKLYDVETDGIPLWSEEKSVEVKKGIFNVILGSVNPLTLPFDKQYWLGIAVEGGSELTPRIKLTSSAYSLNTRSDGGGNTLDQAYDQGGPGAGRTINADAGAVNIEGTDGLTVEGCVSIGTTDRPRDSRFTVQGGAIGLINEATHSVLTLRNYNSSGWLNSLEFLAARGSIASPSPLQNNDPFGMIEFRGYDGLSYPEAAFIKGEVDGVTGVGNMPSRLRFLTTPDGSATAVERMRINNAGNVGIGTTNPVAPLHVGRTVEPAEYATFDSGGGGGWITFRDAGTIRAWYGMGARLFDNQIANAAGIRGDSGVQLGTSSDALMTITNGVGIGTTGPRRRLSVIAESVGTSGLEIVAPSSHAAGVGTPITGIDFASNNYRYYNNSIVASIAAENGSPYYADRGQLAFKTGYTDGDRNPLYTRMVISHDGYVGIGTTNPLAKLHIGGTPGTDGIMFPDGTLQKTAFTGGGGGVGDITSVHGVDGLEGGSDEGDVTLRVADRGITTSKLADGAVAPGKIATGTIVDADISSSAAISPNKINGTAWTSANDGSGSGLDADMLDGLHASSFLSTSNDYGRSGVASDLYEGSTRLQDKYLNNDRSEAITANSSTQTLRVENTGSGHGIQSITSTTTDDKAALYGEVTGTSGNTYGVYGITHSPGSSGSSAGTSVGVYGLVASLTAIGGSTAGVLGRTWSVPVEDAATSVGVFGWGDVPSGRTYGVWGETRSSTDNVSGVMGVNLATSGVTRGVIGNVVSTTPGAAGVLGAAPNNGNNVRGVLGYCHSSTGYAVYSDGNFAVAPGYTKSAIVQTSQGAVKMYSQESPENWFEDFGEGQLVNGRAHIELDPLFLETVTINSQHPMKVFIQLNDDCNGVFVKRGDTGFDVIELQKGQSNAHFTYRVVAKRKGFEDKRLERSETD